MSFTVRPATADDLAHIVALTRAHRRRLAGWESTWWRPSAMADQIHPAWLEHLLGHEGSIVRVVEHRGAVVGCAAALRQPEQWFVDDVALADDSEWSTAGVALMDAVTERPALTCVPHGHTARGRATREAGLALVSSYWVRPLDGTPPALGPSGPRDVAPVPLPADRRIPAAPPHSFGGALDPGAPGALAFAAGDGLVVGSPSIAAPPVYDPGGTVVVVDRIAGDDPAALLRQALGAAAARGDVAMAVVASRDDEGLQGHLAAAGFHRAVDVHAWPEP